MMRYMINKMDFRLREDGNEIKVKEYNLNIIYYYFILFLGY